MENWLKIREIEGRFIKTGTLPREDIALLLESADDFIRQREKLSAALWGISQRLGEQEILIKHYEEKVKNLTTSPSPGVE